MEDDKKNVEINLSEPVALTFSLKYLVNFCKAAGLSDNVKLCLSNEVPLLVEYGLANNSYLRFYLAPKVGYRPYSCVVSRQALTFSCRSAMRSKHAHRRERTRDECMKGVQDAARLDHKCEEGSLDGRWDGESERLMRSGRCRCLLRGRSPAGSVTVCCITRSRSSSD